MHARIGKCVQPAAVLPLAALRLFSPSEFNQLLSGGQGGGVDVDDWRGALHLRGGGVSEGV